MSDWSGPLARGYCVHGSPDCGGWPDVWAPCLPSEHRYCAHGFDASTATDDGRHRCPWCRGVTRRERNPDVWRPPRVRPGGPGYDRG